MRAKRWQDIILQRFGHEQTQSVVVVDPDGLMQDGALISELQARNYDILNFTTDRNDFEERYRSRWDRREKTRIVVIVHSNEGRRRLPYDLERKSRVIEIGLHDVFPRLNRIVLAGLDRHYYPALFTSHATLERDNTSCTTETETIRFILRGVFGIDPVALKSPEQLVATLINKHYATQASEALRSCTSRARRIAECPPSARLSLSPGPCGVPTARHGWPPQCVRTLVRETCESHG